MHVKTSPHTPAHVNSGTPVERLHDSREARKILGGISEWYFRQLTKSGELRSVKQGRYVYVPQSAIDEYIAALPSAAEPPVAAS